MSVVLNTNEQSTRIRSIYNRNVGQMNAAMTRLATTRKINSAKDGAANWAISEKMRERIRANDQANQNVQNDTALLKTAQDGYSNTLDILQTLKERAINSANDANVSTDRIKIAEEVKQLVAQIDDNAAKVKFNGRQLLNGASETATTSTTATKKATSTSTANAVTATEPQGTHSVYSITGLKVWDSSENKLRSIGDTTTNATADANVLLTDLRDAESNVLFKKGDKITFSWNDNGEAKQTSYTVTEMSVLSDITGLLNGSNTVGATSFGSDTGIKAPDTNLGTSVKNADGVDVDTEDAGIYIVAKDSDRKITDVAISVSREDGADAERLDRTQALLEPNAVMQNASKDSFATGSNQVYSVNAGTGDLGLLYNKNLDQTRWMDLQHSAAKTANEGDQYVYDSHLSTGSTDEDTEITMTVNGKDVKFKAGSTIEQLNQILKDNDINVRVHIAEANDVLKYDDEAVTKGDSTSTATYKAASKGLYIIAGEGEIINELKFDGGTAGLATKFALTRLDLSVATASTVTASSGAFDEKLALSSDFLNGTDSTVASARKTASSDSLLPQGEALQFFVGGEANFGINFTFGKANVENLFGMTGDKFAKMFETKETAEEALTYIDDAINKTLVEQTRLGALEARLGYTSDNLTSMNTNLESGISAYRDADIAKEMTDYMKYSVLQQSSQYMLAQATQNPFSVLQLLQP